jgi:hypothetical protein
MAPAPLGLRREWEMFDQGQMKGASPREPTSLARQTWRATSGAMGWRPSLGEPERDSGFQRLIPGGSVK